MATYAVGIDLGTTNSALAYRSTDRDDTVLRLLEVPQLVDASTVEASRRYLAHLAAAWNVAFPTDPLDRQHVVLTVPASFDAAARELTREAAVAAGLPEDFVLLEEPQAAVYAWIAERGDDWRRDLRDGGLGEGDVVLVTDVGGGTTDFTLIGVESQDGELSLLKARPFAGAPAFPEGRLRLPRRPTFAFFIASGDVRSLS